MSSRMANELYDIFVRELRARETTRWDFIEQYEAGRNEIPIYFAARYRSDARAWFMRKPEHLGEVFCTFDLQGAIWTNEAIRDLERWLVSIPPVDRLAWMDGEIERP